MTAAPAAARWRVETWDPAYGASTEEQSGPRLSNVEVAPEVEVHPERWRPLDPRPGAPDWSSVLFVDGVRRVDAIAWRPDGSESAGPAMGLFASYAAGVVRCRRGEARLVAAEIHRGLFTGAARAGGVAGAEGVGDVATSAGRYVATPVIVRADSGTPPAQQLGQAVQAKMRAVEVEVSQAARAGAASNGAGEAADDDLLVVDGPLHGRAHLPRTLGYIKTHSRDYLPPELHRVVGQLEPGQRTPAFLLLDSWRRYTWYLKLPGRPGVPWAGVVRVECSAELSPAEVTELADRGAPTLCRYASAEYKDSRAPQNLHPIAGLERELRRRLGDQRLLYRAIRRAAG